MTDAVIPECFYQESRKIIFWIPAFAGMTDAVIPECFYQESRKIIFWIPAFAGMTISGEKMELINKKLKSFIWISLGIMILLFLIVKIREYDIWFHLRIGKYILENLSIPKLDPFSYTASSNLYIDSHWLYQIILYAFYNFMGGAFGLFLFQTTIVLFTFYLLFKISNKSNFYISVVCILITLFISNIRFNYRPEILSYLFSLLFIFNIQNYSETKENKYLYILPVLQVLWVNIHGLFVFGPIIVFSYFIGEFIQDKRLPKNILLCGIICSLACIINPYGYKLVVYPFILFGEMGSTATSYMKSVSELTPTLLTDRGTYDLTLHIILIIISSMSFILARKINFSRLIIYFAFLYLSFMAIRNIVIFSFIASFVTIMNVRDIKDIKDIISQKILNYVAYILMILLFVFNVVIIYSVITGKYYRYARVGFEKYEQIGIGSLDIMFPKKAIEYIKNNNLSGNVFNDAHIGGYFMWHCYPERKVFFDGRMEVYGEELMAEYKSVIDNPEVFWQNIENKYKIDYVLLHPLSIHSQNLIKYLFLNKMWKLAYFDESGIIYTKKSNKIKPYLKEANFNNYSRNEKILSYLSFANFFYFIGEYKTAKTLYIELLKLDSDSVETYINLGFTFLMMNDLDNAGKSYRRAIQKSNKYPEPYFGLSLIYFKNRKYFPAIQNLGFALRKRPVYPEAQFQLALVYQKVGQFDSSIDMCYEILSRNSSDEKVYNLLGSAYFGKGDTNKAIEQFEKALKINPDYTDAKNNLKACNDLIKASKN